MLLFYNKYRLGSADNKYTRAHTWTDPRKRRRKGAQKLVYHKIADLPAGEFQNTVQKLANKGILKGSSNENGKIIIDLPYESVRLLVLLDRQDVFK